jgi:hypothetical protein
MRRERRIVRHYRHRQFGSDLDATTVVIGVPRNGHFFVSFSQTPLVNLAGSFSPV